MEVLADLLARLRALHWFHWTAHWQTEGGHFYGDHLLFERMYTGMVDEIDGLAEKIVAMHGESVVDPLPSMVRAARFVGAYEGNSLIAKALWAEGDLQEALSETWAALEISGGRTLGLEDFLSAMANAHETNTYLLQQRLKDHKNASRLASSWGSTLRRPT